MSIKTLLEAVKYVENVDTTAAEQNRVTKHITATTDPNINSPDNGIIKHWRKRAVAQSVKELNKKSVASSHSTASKKVADEFTSSQLHKPFLEKVTDFAASDSIRNSTDFNEKTTTLSLAPICCTSSESKTDVLPSAGSEILNDSNQNDTTEAQVVENTSEVLPRIHSTDVPLQDHQDNSSSPAGNKISVDGLHDHTFAKQKSQLGAGTREAHNKLEKSRRAYLKECFEMLRKALPTLGAKKISNLIVLREALKHVQILKRKGKKQEHELDVLAREKIIKTDTIARLRRKLSEHLDIAEIENILKRASSSDAVQKDKCIDNNVKGGSFFVSTSSAGNTTVSSTNSLSNTAAVAGERGSIMVQQIELSALIGTSSVGNQSGIMHPFSVPEKIARLDSGNLVVPKGMITVSPLQSDSKIIRNAGSVTTQLFAKGHIPPPVSRLTQISAKSSFATLPAIEAITATSHKIQSVKTYHGKGVGITSIIGGRPNQMKIVVKPVDSAKQQARAVKTSEAIIKRSGISNDLRGTQKSAITCQAQKQTEFVFRPRSSLTPPPPSRITPYFPRFSVGSGGSPPLTEVMPNINEVPTQTTKEEHIVSSQSKFSIWRTKCDGLEQLEKKNLKKKHTLPMNDRSYPMKISRMSVDIVQNSPAPLLTKSLAYSKPRLDSETDSETEMASSQTDKCTAPAGMLVTKTLPASGVLHLSARRQNKSVTQVCYSTLKATKPTVLLSPSKFLPRKQQASQDKTSNSNLVATNTKSLSQPISSYQTQMPIVGYQITQPSIIDSATLIANSSASTTMTSSTSVPCLPTISQSVNVQAGTMTSSSSNASVSVADVPQVQYLMPIGYSGMLTNAGGTPVAFPQTMGGFIPMVPQGQRWGYVLPRQMVLATNNGNNASTLSVLDAKTSLASSVGNEVANPQEQQSSIVCSNTFVPANALSSQSYVHKTEAQCTVNSMPQLQIVAPGYQTGGQFMLPMAAGQAGGFIIGGAPTMISPSSAVANDPQQHQQGGNIGYQVPMNIVGYPVQFGGSSTIQLAPMQNTLKIPQGFSFGYAGGMPTQVLTVLDKQSCSQASTSGSFVSSENVSWSTT